MKKLPLLLLGALASFGATAQTTTDDSLSARSSVVANAVTIAAPLVLLTAITVAAEDNDAGTTPQTATSTATSTAP
mgnify:CR=1 FL=1